MSRKDTKKMDARKTDDGDGTVLVITLDPERMLAERCMRRMAAHEGDDLPDVVLTSTAQWARAIGFMLADLHTLRATGRDESEKNIAEVEKLFARALRLGLEHELAQHRRRRAEDLTDEPEGAA